MLRRAHSGSMGSPAVGKVCYAHRPIETLMEEPGLAFFYFDFRDSTKQTVYGLLSCLVYQLASRSSDCNSLLTQFYGKHCGNRPQHPNDDLLVQCLKSMLQVLPNVYLVFDALDECPEATRHKDLFPILQKLIGFKKEGFHLLVTSRPEQDIKKVIMSNLTQDLDLAKSQEIIHHVLDLDKTTDHADDIHHYISKKVSMMEDWSTALRETVQTSLVSKADGMFLLASLQLQTLRRCLPVTVKEVLEALPSSLSDMYRRVLESIDIANRPLAFHIFECLAYACRSLSPKELAEVLIVDFEKNGGSMLKPAYRVQDAVDSLFKICSSLIQVVDIHGVPHSSKIVQFAHLSIRDYLVSTDCMKFYHLEPSHAHTTLAKLCISNLIYPSPLSTLPLGPYAADYWLMHMLESNGLAVDVLGKPLIQLLHPRSHGHFTEWRSAYVHGMSYNTNARALYCAAALGQSVIMQEWLLKSTDIVNMPGGPSGTALCVAAKEGKIQIVSLLLESNVVAVDAQGNDN
ncbi:hypothetical protein BT96DRAFT_93841, partial [Gymnopus androsaceus JB14]